MSAAIDPAVEPAVQPVALVEELTPQWLSAALGREVTSAEASAVGTGQMGSCYRLVLTGDPALPATILAKLPATTPGMRELMHGSYATEVRFYNQLCGTVDVTTPGCSYAAISEDPERRGSFTLLLEDLAPAEQGDQIAGCSPETVRAAVTNIAGLHGPRWSDPTLLEVEGFTLPGPEDGAMLDATFADAVDIVVAALSDLISAADAKSEQCIRILRRIFARQRADAESHLSMMGHDQIRDLERQPALECGQGRRQLVPEVPALMPQRHRNP